MTHFRKLSIIFVLLILSPIVFATNTIKATALGDHNQSIHTTTVYKPDNQPMNILAKLGHWQDGQCIYSKTIPDLDYISNLKENNTMSVCLDCLREAGPGFTCMSWVYEYKGKEYVDTFELVWDGTDYKGSTPAQSTVILN